MTRYNIVVPEEYEDKQTGEVKTAYHRVGVAFPISKGGFSCKLPTGKAGIALTGEFLILPRKEVDDGAQGAGQEDES